MVVTRMGTKDMSADLALARLLQLSSVSLPVGGYSFSQGLEYAVECAWLKKVADVEAWVTLQLHENIARVDLPILREVMIATENKDWIRLLHLNDLLLASRETKELRLSDTAMGEALLRLLKSLDFDLEFLDELAKQGGTVNDISFVSLFGLCAKQWNIPYRLAATGFTWSWLENQVAAATKLVPLGQTQAQQLLVILQPVLGEVIDAAELISEEEVGGGLPALAIASALHETQYSRLFRS
ncbi:MAG: urease accessory protein [Oleiphilaceae bacterium]|jgi:urease accessory protein